MKKTAFGFVLILVLSASTYAAPPQHLLAGSNTHIAGGSVEHAKTAVDTVLLIGPYGSGSWYNGQFESSNGSPDWNGWTSHDLSVSHANAWHISDYHAEGLNGHPAGNSALWCGSMDFPACNAGDEVGGYGNNYHEIIEWTSVVADPGQPCQVTVEAFLNYDLEYGYDYLYLQAHLSDGNFVHLFEADGQSTNFHLLESFTYQPGEYFGVTGDEVRLRFVVMSDGAYSDEDCSFSGIGACQIDDIRVQMSNGGINSFSDFEDGTLGDWQKNPILGVGDFAKIWMNLHDIDPCQENATCQVAFIDDGNVVPGTGGTPCVDWCYGPGGYIVNNTGGLLGESHHLDNYIYSPVVDVSSLGTNGYFLEYDVYSHLPLSFDDAGIFRLWGIRSTTSDNPEDIELEQWDDFGYLYYGSGYTRDRLNVSSLVKAGAKHIQVSMGLTEIGWAWGWYGENGTPAPYYDNVRLSAFEMVGPAIGSHKERLAQDAFPASGQLDLDNPSSCSVRFDMASATVMSGQYLTVAGDSIIADVTVVRDGAVLHGLPQLNYRLKANPAFDSSRISGLPLVGAVDGWVVHNDDGQIIPNRFAFDLPDTGFLFPGDVLHYYISGTDELMGTMQTATMPADTTGFSNMEDHLAFDPLFTVRALPSVNITNDNLQQDVSVLFWNDGGKASRLAWNSALINNGLIIGENCDVYYTAAPWSDVGNGLGQKATPEQLAGYSIILYTSGNLTNEAMTEADAWLISQWLEQEDKHLLATGDNLMSELNSTSAVTQELLADKFGVQVLGGDIRPMIGGQSTALVMADAGNPVFAFDQEWLANGGCPSVNTFDAVEILSGAARLASFTNAAGNPGFSYSAATLCQNQGTVVSLPFALDYVSTSTDGEGNSYGMSARSYLLRRILDYFGQTGPIIIADTPDAVKLMAVNHPNPFNPSTSIEFVLPATGHMSVKIFDVRGNLIETLLDEQRAAGPGQVTWHGTDAQGGKVSSGVYFYEVRTGTEVRVQKMALVK